MNTEPFDHDDRMRRLSERQWRLVATWQCRIEDIDRWARQRRSRGDWEVISPRLLRLRGAPPDVRQSVMAAVLDGGPAAVASHQTAAALWRLPGFSYGSLHVSRPRGLSGSPVHLAAVHEPRYLPAHLLTGVSGIPVTCLAFTLFNLAPVIKPQRLERVLDTVIGRSPGTLTTLHRILPELAERGRPGIRLMRELLADRPVGERRPTGLEARFERILAEAGEPPMRRQVDLGGHEWIGRVDYVDDYAPGLIAEIDSLTHHSSKLDQALDAIRDEQLRAIGYTEVLRIAEELVWYDPAEVLRRVREARDRVQSASGSSFGLESAPKLLPERRRAG